MNAVSTRLSRAFWMLCTMEMWERLAYYGMRVVVPIYIMQADEPGGLHFTAEDKGTIYLWWFVVQSILPTFTGGFADRYGYKKTIAASVGVKVLGYVLMATQRTFWGFFLGTMLLALGTAQFKPGIQGSLASHLDDSNSSKGWGVFYWLVNVGAMIGPPLAGLLRGWGWDTVFFGCAGIVSINFLMLFTYQDKKPEKVDERGFGEVFTVTLKNFFQPRLLLFLFIMSGFWLMMYQLWDLHPNFLSDWVYSGSIAETFHLPESWTELKSHGLLVKQENLLNLNALMIVLFVIPVSIAVKRMRTLSAMFGGMIMATFGIIIAGMSQNAWLFLAGVVCFSLGEMLTGPKKNEYLGKIAPPGKKGQYLGYVNIPVGIGGAIGSKMAGYYYGNFGEKAVLAQRYLAENTDYLTTHGGGTWNGDIAALEETLGGVGRDRSMDVLMETLGQTGEEVTNLLWNTYSPQEIWYPFIAVGVVSIIGLFFYNRAARGWADMNK